MTIVSTVQPISSSENTLFIIVTHHLPRSPRAVTPLPHFLSAHENKSLATQRVHERVRGRPAALDHLSLSEEKLQMSEEEVITPSSFPL